jgi:hypothetical protein
VPLAVVLLASRPSVAGLCLSLAACVAFAAHEPLVLVLGQRGGRARREEGQRALRRLVLAALIVVGTALVAFGLAPNALPWATIPVVLAGGATLFILRRRERTLAGELVSSSALTWAALPVAVANGMTSRMSIVICAVFSATSFLSTLEVRAVARRDTSPAARVAGWIFASSVVLVLALHAPAFALAAAPAVLTIVAIAGSHPKPTRLRQIGWTLATASLVTAAALVIAARAS